MGKTFTVERIPEDVHRRFKAMCVLQGRSMSQRIIELMDTTARSAITTKDGEPMVLSAGVYTDDRE